MKKATLTLGAGLILLTGWLLVAGIASAEQETRFDYLLGGTAFGIPPGACVPDPPDPDFCITTATSFFGETVEIQGSGDLQLKENGDHKVTGNGFWLTATDGGSWKAKKLLMFDSYGPGDVPPNEPAWRSGRALILIELSGADGTRSAVLEVGCRIAGNDGLGVGETIEGVRLTVEGGLNYNIAADPSITLFIAKGARSGRMRR